MNYFVSDKNSKTARLGFILLEDGDIKNEFDRFVYDDQELKCIPTEEIGKMCACNEIRLRCVGYVDIKV